MDTKLKVLAIGNSFSTDSTRYLHEICTAGGISSKVVNLYIGGCSLATHYKNINNDDRAYALEFNGHSTGFYVSVREALQSDMWDFVTMQQASHYSTDYNTYVPYLKALSEYVKLHAPKATQVFHRTWGYENGSDKLCNEQGYDTHDAMFAEIKVASGKATREIGLDFTIASGDLIERMTSAGVKDIYRDSYHLSLGIGRYAVAALWYERLTGNSIAENNFQVFDEKIDSTALAEIKKFVANTKLYHK